jgi:hypothetical protein
MPATLQVIVSDQFRIFGLKSDGSLWVASTREPLQWSALPAWSGSGAGVVSSIALARMFPSDPSLSLYCTVSDGSLWRLTPANSWFKENTP